MERTPIDRVIEAVGSYLSLILHTFIFAVFFGLAILDVVSWGLMLLVLTTIVSLEAIYLAIFIQMTVNRQAQELAEVSEDVEDIQEDIEEDEEFERQQTVALEGLMTDVRKILADLEQLKKK